MTRRPDDPVSPDFSDMLEHLTDAEEARTLSDDLLDHEGFGELDGRDADATIRGIVDPADPAVDGVLVEGRHAQPGLALVFGEQECSWVLTRSDPAGLVVAASEMFATTDDDREVGARIRAAAREHGVSLRRPMLGLAPGEYDEEVVRLPPLRPRELRRWRKERRRVDPKVTADHLLLDGAEGGLEVLEIRASTQKLCEAVSRCRRMGLGVPRIVPPHLSALGRLGAVLRVPGGSVLVADMLDARHAALHLWSSGKLEIYRPVRLPLTRQGTWDIVAREVMRTVAYFRERSHGTQVQDVILVRTGGPLPSVEGREALERSDAFRGEVRCVEAPTLGERPRSARGLAAHLACCHGVDVGIDLLPESVRSRPRRRILLAGLAVLWGLFGLTMHTLRQSGQLELGDERARFELLETSRAEVAAKVDLLRESLAVVDHYDQTYADLQEIEERRAAALHALRLVSDRLPAELELSRIAIDRPGPRTQVVLEGVVQTVYADSTERQQRPTASGRDRSPLEMLRSTLAGLGTVRGLQAEILGSDLPRRLDDGRWVGEDRFRVRFEMTVEELP